LPENDDAANTAPSPLNNCAKRARSLGVYFGGTYKSWNKSHGNPVTEADIEIDNFLRQKLLAARPRYGWLSEETADDPGPAPEQTCVRRGPDRRHLWFSQEPCGFYHRGHGRRKWQTRVGRGLQTRSPIEMFDATKGQGARKNGTPTRVSKRSNFDGARFSGGKEGDGPGALGKCLARIAHRRKRAHQRPTAWRWLPQANSDAMISLSPQNRIWDVAAGDLMVHEARRPGNHPGGRIC